MTTDWTAANREAVLAFLEAEFGVEIGVRDTDMSQGIFFQPRERGVGQLQISGIVLADFEPQALVERLSSFFS